jgi:hypothetical protein
LLRSGKSASQIEARLVEGEHALCSAIGVFGAARESSVRIVPAQPLVECAEPLVLPYIAGITPSFVQHFSVRWLRGGLPYSGSTLPQIVAEIDLNDRGSASEKHVLGIADYIPPIGLTMIKRPAPGSSMTWMIEFFGEPLEGLPLQGWRMDGELVAAGEGYTSQSGMLWGPQGRLVALSRQSMVVFA